MSKYQVKGIIISITFFILGGLPNVGAIFFSCILLFVAIAGINYSVVMLIRRVRGKKEA